MKDSLARPNIYVVAGPNGAGKTTFATEFLPHYADCRNFVNADLIAKGLSPFAPSNAAFRAGRLMLREVEAYAERNESFGFETTLSGRSYKAMLGKLKVRGYAIRIYFLWAPDVNISIARIRERVSKGGHDVPEVLVRRRFTRSIKNFLGIYSAIAESWILFDNSKKPPAAIALKEDGDLHIMNREVYEDLSLRFGG